MARKSLVREAQKDALALAELIYDIYKENQANDKIVDGQNNAQQTPDN